MRFLLEGYNISLPFVVTQLEIWKHVPWKNFHNGGLFLPIIHQKMHVLKSLKPMHGDPRIPITTFIFG